MKTKLSVVVIASDDSTGLKDTLRSAEQLADEVVVEKSKEYNLGKKRNIALSKAKGPWILVLDTDEVVGPGLKQEIKKAIKNKKNHMDIRFLSKIIFWGGLSDMEVRAIASSDCLRKVL